MVEFKPSARTQTRRIENKKSTKTRSKAVRTKTKQTETLIRDDANALLENRADRTRLMQMRKNVVCAVEQPDYDASRNGDQYNFLPERCHKKGISSRDSKKLPKIPNTRRTNTTLPHHESQIIIHADYDAVNRLVQQYPIKALPNTLPKVMNDIDANTKIMAHQMFVIAHLEKMISLRMIMSFPNPVDRINHLLAQWSGGVMMQPGWSHIAEKTRIRMYVMMKVHYDNVFAL